MAARQASRAIGGICTQLVPSDQGRALGAGELSSPRTIAGFGNPSLAMAGVIAMVGHENDQDRVHATTDRSS